MSKSEGSIKYNIPLSQTKEIDSNYKDIDKENEQFRVNMFLNLKNLLTHYTNESERHMLASATKTNVEQTKLHIRHKRNEIRNIIKRLSYESTTILQIRLNAMIDIATNI